MRHRYSAQRASVLERPIVPGGERPYQQVRMRSLWEAAGREDGGWIAPVLPRVGHRQGQKATARDAHEELHRVRYFFNTNPNNIPMPAAIKTDCNGLARMPSSSVFSTASICWRPCW